MIRINKPSNLFVLGIKDLCIVLGMLIIIVIPNISYAQNSSYPESLIEISSNSKTTDIPIYVSADGKDLSNSSSSVDEDPTPVLEKKQDILQSMRQSLYRLINKRTDTSIKSYVFTILIALIVGGLHALTPGHGKTIIGAYFVGSNGTTKHALILGLIVTLVHTGSVILLTIIALVASHYFLSELIVSLLGIVSGVIILLLGIFLLVVRLRGLSAYRRDNSSHDHGHDFHHRSLSYSEVKLKYLFTIGLSGGIVPCPDAIAILLLAIATKRIFLGLIIMLSFSLGLAMVLTFIGLVMVKSRKLFSKLDSLNKFAPIISVISAVIVVILGCFLTLNALSLTGFSGYK